jgi:hypothetical protein
VSEFLLNLAGIGVLLTPFIFIMLYLGYGNRFRAAAGRALVVWGGGSFILGSIFFLHHPLGLSTDNVPWVGWYQVIGSFLFIAGGIWLITLAVRANGRWPWQRDQDGSGPGEAAGGQLPD